MGTWDFYSVLYHALAKRIGVCFNLLASSHQKEHVLFSTAARADGELNQAGTRFWSVGLPLCVYRAYVSIVHDHPAE